MKPERIQVTGITPAIEWIAARARMTVATWEHEQAHAIGNCLHQLARALGVEGCQTQIAGDGRLLVSIPVDSSEGLSEVQQDFLDRVAMIGEAMTEPFEAD